MNLNDISVSHQWKYSSPLIACRYSPDGKQIVTAAQDQTVQLWDTASSDEKPTPRILKGHESWLRAIQFSPDSAWLYTAGYDGQLLYWNLADLSESPAPSLKRDAHGGWIRALDVSADGQWLATAGNDLHVKLWHAQSGNLVASWLGHESHVYSVFFVPTENVLLTGDLHGQIHQWDLDSNLQRPQKKRTLDGSDLHTWHRGQGAHYGGIRSMSLSPDGRFLAASGLHKATNPFGAVQEPLVIVFDWESGKQIQSHTADGIDRGIAWRCVYHEDGSLLAAVGGSSGGYLLSWKQDSEKPKGQFKLPNTALDMDLSPCQTQIATTHHSKQLIVCKTV